MIMIVIASNIRTIIELAAEPEPCSTSCLTVTIQQFYIRATSLVFLPAWCQSVYIH